MNNDNKVKVKRHISIKTAVISAFMAVMLISFGTIGYFVFSGWISSAKKATGTIAEEVNQHIYKQIDSYVQSPARFNESIHNVIENQAVDFTGENTRDKFFAGILYSADYKLYSVCYATADGRLYGARRNNAGLVEIVRNDGETGGNTRYYSTNRDFSAGEVIDEEEKSDPRLQVWYKSAVEREYPTFSPVYINETLGEMAISYACPVYNSDGSLNGVLGSQMLISDIGLYLNETVSRYDGYVIIFEKENKQLVAHSQKALILRQNREGEWIRTDLDNLENRDLQLAYANYLEDYESGFYYEGKDDNWYMNVKEIEMTGLKWMVISAIPESYLLGSALKSFSIALILTGVFLALSLAVYIILTSKLLKPISSLLSQTVSFAEGDLSARAEVKRNDEIGLLTTSFNNMAEEIQSFVTGLEDAVKKRTLELENTNKTLEENKNRLQLILDSAAEGIYGMDLEGKCTFCNKQCVEILGYKDQSELLGKEVHNLIHHTNKDRTTSHFHECAILKAIEKGEGVHSDEDMFWRADGTSFDVEYHSYPQIQNGRVVGAVITFMDITQRKQREAEIQYLYSYDTLTGLLNRRSFEDNRNSVDIPENLPLSVIFADINGLKITNDVFGHSAGDRLIKKSSDILKQACRPKDLLARIGGDEFVLLLPKIPYNVALEILDAIKQGFADARMEAVKCSISLGVDTKQNSDQSLDEAMANAENAMYKDKILYRNSTNKDIVDTIIHTLHLRSVPEKDHSESVSALAARLGKELNLPEDEIIKLKRAAYLHDIGKIVLEKDMLEKYAIDEEELEKFKQHSVVGYRILNLFDETLDVAEYVYSHHERWDGKGYPRGIKGEQIPLISRIISLTETFDRIYRRNKTVREDYKQVTLEEIKRSSGTQFDPRLTEVFLNMAEKDDFLL
jgi:diguanylate cyclase (GGDEF)-like protein/PAS domain S-box-containing protein/putative nucleotidyltransferase with HDIG domain